LALVLPARVVEDWIKTDALDRHAGLTGRRNLMADDPQPSRPQVTLDARLGDEQRPPVALVEGGEQASERPVLRVVNRDRQVAVNPLVVKMVNSSGRRNTACFE